MKPRILVVDDEAGLRLTLGDRLASEGYQVECAEDGEAGLEAATRGHFDLILLDVMLPKMGGFDVCRTLRQRGCVSPILMLTARGQVVDKVVGLKLGADDYLTKPFEMMELTARVEALLRRRPSGPEVGEVFRFGDVSVDLRRAEVTRAGCAIDLSAREFKLLRHFIEHRGATVSRDELLVEVWGYSDDTPLTRTVDVHMASLRQKIEANPRTPEFLLTVHGLGYKFVG